MEIGSCKGGPFGFFVFVWSNGCPVKHLSVAQVAGVRCPDGANDYGFVVAAPSRGMTPDEFRAIVENSMNKWRGGGKDYRPGAEASVNVPISPPVALDSAGIWKPTAVPTAHSVSFRWPDSDKTSILGDSATAGLFGATQLGGAPKTWPTAIGHVTAPDSESPTTALVSSDGQSCLTIAGLPTPKDRDPMGLLIDLRSVFSPVVTEHRNSALISLCK